MKTRTFVALLLVIVLGLSFGVTQLCVRAGDDAVESEEFNIVTSFYPLYIATLNIAGDIDGVHVTNMSEPQTGCLHDFQMTPHDMRALSKADAFVACGSGMESFLSDVIDQYPNLAVIQATKGLKLESEDGEKNGHAWMSVSLYRKMLSTIVKELVKADPDHAHEYMRNYGIYDDKVARLYEDQQDLLLELSKENVVIFHEAFEYLAMDMNLNVIYSMDLDSERQLSAGEISSTIRAIKRNKVQFILAESLYGEEMGRLMQDETDVKVIYLNTLTRPVDELGDMDEKDYYLNGQYANMMIIQAYMLHKEINPDENGLNVPGPEATQE